MSIRIVSIGTKVPNWTSSVFHDYQKRLPRDWAVTLTEVPAAKRLKNTDLSLAMEQESHKLWQHCHQPHHNPVVGLDRTGKKITSKAMASQLGSWKNQGKTTHFLIGGPEGITPSVLEQCQQVWSFSELTFPQPLVRVILIEQIYRAFCIVNHRTYHR